MARNPANPRGPYRHTREQGDEVRRRYEAGETWEQIGAALGLTPEGVRDRLHQAGVALDRRTPRWEAAQDWPWPLTLEEVALRLYGEPGAGARRRAGSVVGNWVRLGFLVRVGWARYTLKPQGWEEDSVPP